MRDIYLNALLAKPEVSMLPSPDVECGVDFEKLYIAQTIVEEKKEENEEKQSFPLLESVSPERRMESAVMQKETKRVEVDLWETLKEHHRLMVEAPAWTGKSTLCRWVTQHCVAQTGWLPIFIYFRDLAQSGKSIQRYLEQDYTEWLGLQGCEIEIETPAGSRKSLAVGSWLFNLWQAGQALLILDGADEEFDKTRRDKAFASLPAARERTTRPRILLTSRPLGDGGVLGFEKLALNEFERRQIEELVRRCGEILGEQEKASQFIKEIQRAGNERALQLGAKPGHLMQMFATYVQENVVLTAEEDLMNKVAESRFAITGRVTPKLEPDEPVYKRQVAEEVAFHMLFCRQGQAQDREQTLQLVSHALMAVKIHETSVYTPKDGVKMLEDLCCNSGFLKRTRRGVYEFESVPWMQFFAACYIARLVEAEEDKAFRQWVFTSKGLDCLDCRKKLYSFIHYFRNPKWEENIKLLARVMKDPNFRWIAETYLEFRGNKNLSLAAVRKLGRIGGSLAVAPLVEALEVNRLNERYARVVNAKDDTSASILLRQEFDEEDWVERYVDGGELLYYHDHSIDQAKCIREVVAFRRKIVVTLGKIGEIAAVPALVEARRDISDAIRDSAEEALEKIFDARTVHELVAALENESYFVRDTVLKALKKKIGVARAVKVLIAALKDDNKSLRHAAAYGLGEIRDTHAMEALVNALKNDDNKSVRQAAVNALGNIGGTVAVDALAEALKDDDNESVRQAAAYGLGKIGNNRAMKALKNALNDKNAYVCMAAAGALEDIENARRAAKVAKENARLVAKYGIAATWVKAAKEWLEREERESY